MKKHIIFLGPPGAGKGTQAKLLQQRLSFKHISTGDLLRDEISRVTDLGKRIKSILESGELVDDDTIMLMVEEALTPNIIQQGFIFDGFPRTIVQARKLDTLVKKHNFNIDVAIYVSIDESTAIERISNRRVCSKCGAIYHLLYNPPTKPNVCDKCGGVLYQRNDDKEETVRNRYKIYLKHTHPLIEYYNNRELLVNISGTKRPEEIFNDIIAALK